MLWACASGDSDEPFREVVPPDASPGQDAKSVTDLPDVATAFPDAQVADAFVPQRPDASPDANLDATPDSTPDAFVDAALDSGAIDAAPDQPIDAHPILPPDAAPDAACLEETCNGLDDDCDGTIDEGVCGSWIARNCRVFVGWADNDQGPGGASETWGVCPAADRAANGDLRCTGTRAEGRFALLHLPGDVNGDDMVAVALQCSSAAQGALADYVESHCAVFLGWADRREGPNGSFSWGGCPEQIRSGNQALRCTSSGYDGRFRAITLDGDVNDDDQFGIAWICRDPEDAPRARALQASVELFMGWADNNRGAADNSISWGACPDQYSGFINSQRCVGTRGEGRFRRLELGGDVNDDDDLGFMIRGRP